MFVFLLPPADLPLRYCLPVDACPLLLITNVDISLPAPRGSTPVMLPRPCAWHVIARAVLFVFTHTTEF